VRLEAPLRPQLANATETTVSDVIELKQKVFEAESMTQVAGVLREPLQKYKELKLGICWEHDDGEKAEFCFMWGPSMFKVVVKKVGQII